MKHYLLAQNRLQFTLKGSDMNIAHHDLICTFVKHDPLTQKTSPCE